MGFYDDESQYTTSKNSRVLCGFVESTGGRKAVAVRFVASTKIVLGAELLKDFFEVVAINLYGDVLFCERHQLLFRHDPTYYRVVCEKIQEFAARHNFAKKRILGLGIVLQGLISSDGNRVTYGKILSCTGLTTDAFTQYLPYKCRLFHDAESAARLELWADKNLKNAIFFNVRTNLSGALIVDGHFLQGNNLKSGVFEHMTLVPDGSRCYCGKKGCIDVYCSYPVLLGNGETLEQFFTGLRRAEKHHEERWAAYLDHLASAIDNLHMVIDYDIILGGTLGMYLKPGDIDLLHQLIQNRTAFPFSQPFIRIATQTNVPPAKGAALQFVTAYLNSVMGTVTY